MSLISVCLLLLSIIVFTFGHDPRYQTGRNADDCPFSVSGLDYTPQGREFALGNVSVYETQDQTPKRLLIAIYDAFGISNQVKFFMDKIAQDYGFRVVLPDVFRGRPLNPDTYPPTEAEMAEWLQNVANWDIVKYDVQNVLNYYRNRYGITEVGMFGFCFGGYASIMGSIDFPEIKVTGIVHPGLVTNDMAYRVQAPTYIIPARDDADFLPFYGVMRNRFGDNSGHIRFNDMCHGFAGFTANFSNPLNFQRVEHTIDVLGGFFVRNLRNQLNTTNNLTNSQQSINKSSYFFNITFLLSTLLALVLVKS